MKIRMYTINNGKAKDAFMLTCLREIAWTSAQEQILLRAKFVRSKDNILPDALSRWYQSSEARHTVKHIINKNWKRRTINNKLSTFNHFW